MLCLVAAVPLTALMPTDAPATDSANPAAPDTAPVSGTRTGSTRADPGLPAGQSNGRIRTNSAPGDTTAQ
jgi:hypothetical protein